MPPALQDPWRQCFAAHGAALLLYARAIAASPSDAEDLVQEAFVRTWRHLGSHPTHDPRPLLFLNAKRTALDWGRSRQSREARQKAWAESLAEGTPWFEPTDPAAGERGALLEAALRQLPPEQREVVTLKIWSGLTFAQMAEVLGIPPATAASRYRYALSRLKHNLEALAHA